MTDQDVAIAPAMVICSWRSPNGYMTVVLCPHSTCANDVSTEVHAHMAGDDGEILTGIVRSACGDNHPPYRAQRASDADCRKILAAVHSLGRSMAAWVKRGSYDDSWLAEAEAVIPHRADYKGLPR